MWQGAAAEPPGQEGRGWAAKPALGEAEPEEIWEDRLLSPVWLLSVITRSRK